jgi:RNA polymerase sigma-70 factor (ECF subfamily)
MGLGLEERAQANVRIRRAMARGNRHRALSLLMEAYGTPLFAVCLRYVNDRPLAEDVHQTCFVQAFESLERVLERNSVAAWLMAIARNRCLDALKILRRRRRWQVLPGVLPEAHDGRSSAEEALHQAELLQRLRQAVAELSEETQRAVELRYSEALSYEQMAVLCAARPGTLQMRVARAMPVLRRSLEARGITRA